MSGDESIWRPLEVLVSYLVSHGTATSLKELSLAEVRTLLLWCDPDWGYEPTDITMRKSIHGLPRRRTFVGTANTHHIQQLVDDE